MGNAVDFSVQNGIAKVILDHPPLNILSEKVKEELTNTFRIITDYSGVRVLLFVAKGDHFCCGANLKEFPDRIANKSAGEVWTRGHEMLAEVMNAPQPTIAYIQGNALGGGAELASAFDIRIFSSTAQIGYPEVLRGVFPGNGGLERLISLVGPAKAMNLVLTGKPISAERALQLGIASEIVESSDGVKKAEELAQYLANLPGVALKAIKKAINLYAADSSTFMDKGKELFYMLHETEDVKEAVNAFLEKRKASFLHK
ncbi:enoyl-CoA hydratase/isomerase family protein [Neobacillus cucumis]|uniref:enoyl-CoA hydratase/isomerase family protein n=1 Tax=Neobacillus cucumis TaxID=1740721 RepID=UPI00203C4874|nr:enoyl-CoA hydratase/isomerase family protein [Neobacillus cucumis]MCM3726537.1 enoyl-CoA hydratase/isomerase family protein [Neobacillus cucumis]